MSALEQEEQILPGIKAHIISQFCFPPQIESRINRLFPLTPLFITYRKGSRDSLFIHVLQTHSKLIHNEMGKRKKSLAANGWLLDFSQNSPNQAYTISRSNATIFIIHVSQLISKLRISTRNKTIHSPWKPAQWMTHDTAVQCQTSKVKPFLIDALKAFTHYFLKALFPTQVNGWSLIQCEPLGLHNTYSKP